MRDLLSSEYFPYGSQYYRAPSPPDEDWDRDLGNMAAMGFNTVKYWIQWRWNHPDEDRFYWDDIDRLMELSERHGLKVMLNTIVDVAPAWIYRSFPDASMLTLDGRRIGPQTQSHRQIGGLGYCFNHKQVVDHMFRFLEAAFERYSDHPALEIWNFGSEPELTSSMSEMRLYADDARKMGDMLCFCDHCRTAFHGWLERKYGTIEKLNHSWNRNYRSFEDVELPKTRNTFNDMLDWRMFFVDTLGENVRRRHETARRIDNGRHPLMCHHVFIQGFPVTSTANDPWNVGQIGDLHGFTQMDDPMMSDILRCCARGKPVISAEMLMLMGYTLDLHPEISADDVKRHVFSGIAANQKGFVFWQYRPEMLGREAPAWGLSHLDGTTTPWLDAFAEIGRVLQKETSFLFDASPRPARTAILYHPQNQIFIWAATGNEKNATHSLLGAHRALYERSYGVDFIHPKEFDSGVLDQYELIVLTTPYVLSREIADALKQWVRNGGTLISECYPGGWNIEEGRHNTTVPGYGLHDVFQARQKNAVPGLEHRYLSISGVVREADSLEVRRGVGEGRAGDGFVAAQPVDPSGELGLAEMTTTKSLPGLPAGARLYGSMVRATYHVEGAEVLARYADGEAAITHAAYGEGHAVLIGSYLSLAYHNGRHAANGAFLGGLVEQLTGIEHPISRGGRIRVDVLENGADSVMISVRNLENRGVDATVHVPSLDVEEMQEIFGGEPVRPAGAADGVLLTLSLKPNEVRVYRR